MNNTQIYGAIGYVILNDSILFPNTEILIISDNHDEEYKSCFSDKEIMIDKFLKLYLKDNYKIFLEEIPSNKELIELFPSSSHIKNLRNLYLNNMDKIIGIDIRLNLMDITKLNNSNIPLIYHYKPIYNFFMTKSKLYDIPIINNYYIVLLNKFNNMIKKYYDVITNKSIIDKNILDNIKMDTDNILSDIMEFYAFCRLYAELKDKKNNKLIINCGLYHAENIKNNIIKYLKYNIKKESGINNMSEINKDYICVDYFIF